jgi:hypothetical protein
MRIAFVTAMIVAALAGCKATRDFDTTPAGSGPNKMLDDTAVGRGRCSGGQIDTSPFVVEWDATDLSTFEAHASRDLVLVRYADCAIELLRGCSDGGIPGRYGRYREPVFTSGTVESFAMKDEDELWARLPLGAARFGAAVKVGQSLELRYHVSGVVQATRDAVGRAAIADNPRCAGATHFVSAYNLGAFELLSHKGARGGAEAGVQGSVGVGGTTSSESSNLKHGGSLESCETQAQRACRVPIRLVLQPIDEAAPEPSGPGLAGAGLAPPYDPPPPWEDSPTSRAYQLRQSATAKEAAGDGRGCLDDLERARALEDTPQSRRSSLWLEAQCRMRAGQCGEGQKLLREYLAGIDSGRKSTDEQIDLTVDSTARGKCPVAQQQDLAGMASALMVRIQESQNRSDAAGCVAAGGEAEKIFAGVDRTNVQQRNTVAAVVMMAATCLAQLDRCGEARTWWFRYYDLAFTGTMPANEIKAAAEMTFANLPRCKGK